MVKLPLSQLNIGRGIGALGSSIPGVGDVGTLAFIKRKAGTPIGIGAKQGLKYAGGPIAAASWIYMGYQNRHVPGQVVGNMQLVGSELPDLWRDTRAVKRKPKTKSRRRDGPSILSQRTSRSPSFGKKRRRCTHRNKAGKRCLRPAGHSGRHRYR